MCPSFEDCKPIKIQSPEGQQSIIEQHERAVRVLRDYPNIWKYLYGATWAQNTLNKLLRSQGNVSDAGRDCYLPVYFFALCVNDKKYRICLDRVERVLEVIFRKKVRKKNRNDLIGGLRSCGESHVFEVMLAWSLLEEFGESNVDFYPTVKNQQTIDFAVNCNFKKLLVEATVLYEDRRSNEESLGKLQERFYAITQPPPICYQTHRLIRAIEQKVTQRSVTEPFLLCMNQCCLWPSTEDAKSAIKEFIGANFNKIPQLIGIAYLWKNRFVRLLESKCNMNKIGLSDTELDRFRSAFKLVSVEDD